MLFAYLAMIFIVLCLSSYILKLSLQINDLNEKLEFIEAQVKSHLGQEIIVKRCGHILTEDEVEDFRILKRLSSDFVTFHSMTNTFLILEKSISDLEKKFDTTFNKIELPKKTTSKKITKKSPKKAKKGSQNGQKNQATTI